MTYQADDYQLKAIQTWSTEGNQVRHALLGLAGEAGELLELFKKHEYKPNFSWWDCKHCKKSKEGHQETEFLELLCYRDRETTYTPLVLDELGDWWYYARIITWQQSVSIEQWVRDLSEAFRSKKQNEFQALVDINCSSASMLDVYCKFNKTVSLNSLWAAFVSFMDMLEILNCPLDRLTELNYQKLNSNPGAHGWKVK